MMTSPSTTYAVLIGIDQYDDPQAPNLLGARNDAIAWWHLLTSDLGVPPANITVLASPPIKPEELGGAGAHSNLIEARGRDIETAIKSLSERLSGGEVRGILCYSGHGVTTLADPGNGAEAVGEDLAICPSDIGIAGDGSGAGQLSGLIGYTALHSWIDDSTRENLTVVLDTCHSAPPRDVPHRHLLGLQERHQAAQQAHDKLIERHEQPIGGRVLLAAGHDQSAEELRTTNGWHGAMSHALVSLLPRWELASSMGILHYQVSHHELLYRARQSLAALGAGQQPQLLGRAVVGELPVFKLGASSRLSEVSRQPNRPVPRRQYPINAKGIMLAELIQPGASRPFMYVVVAGGSMTQEEQLLSDRKVVFPKAAGRPLEAWYTGSETFDSQKGVEFRIVAYEQVYNNPTSVGWDRFKVNPKVADLKEVGSIKPIVTDTADLVGFTELESFPGSNAYYYLHYRSYYNVDWYLAVPRALLDRTSDSWSDICWGVNSDAGGTTGGVDVTRLPREFMAEFGPLPKTLGMSVTTYPGVLFWRRMPKYSA